MGRDPASSPEPASRAWPFGCVGIDEVESLRRAAGIRDPSALVDDLLMMVLARIRTPWPRAPRDPDTMRETWVRAYAAAASATGRGTAAAIDAVVETCLEWEALVQHIGPERITRGVVTEFRHWILDRDRSQAPECHERWRERWTRREEWLTAVSDPDQPSPRAADSHRAVGSPSPTASSGHVEAFWRYVTATQAWEAAWDSALRRLWPATDAPSGE